jgi:hypothetical protein
MLSGCGPPCSCAIHATKLSVVTPIGVDVNTPRNRFGLTATGAMLGYVATGEPLALLTVPLGIVLVGAASGVAEALVTGLRKRLGGALRRH